MAYRPDQLTKEETLKEIIQGHARHSGGSPYLLAVHSDRVVTYLELALRMDEWRREVTRFPAVFEGRLGLMIEDPIDFAVTFVALLASGCWVAPVDPALGALSATHLGVRLAPLELTGVISDRPAPEGGDLRWRDIHVVEVHREVEEGVERLDRSGGGVVLSSSGTSGTPKVVALSNRQLLHTARLVAKHNELTPADRGFNPLPLWHINAEVVAVLSTLVAGSSLAIDDHFHRTDFWSTIERLGVTWINAVPAIIAILMNLREGDVVPGGLRFIRSASAPLAPALLAQFEKSVRIPIIETYGMTEAASQICANPLAGPRKTGSVGRPVGVELRLRPIDLDANETSSQPEIGEIEIRGPSVISHYESTALGDRFDDDGWLRTGDHGYLDDDGYLFLVGRADDVINRGGEKIFPREIEDVVLGVPAISKAAVIGVADEVFGQVPVLYVQLHGADRGTAEGDFEAVFDDAHRLLAGVLARARRPVEIVVVETMPTHATGKIQKKALHGEDVIVLARSAFAW